MKKKRMQMSHENATLADCAELLYPDPPTHTVLQKETHGGGEGEEGDDESGDRGRQREDHHEAWGLLDVVDCGHDPYGCHCYPRLNFQCAHRYYPQRNCLHIGYCRCQL